MSNSSISDLGEVGPERAKELLAKIANQVVKRKLTVPAIMFIESVKPLTFIGSQALIFFQPMVQAFLNRKEYDEFAVLMEDRDNVELLLQEIERQEAEWQAREKAEKDEAKKMRKAEGKKTWWEKIKGWVGLK
ncbi:MAG: hypothetical protein A2509_04330 [Candidatus Edwardsbacteria bacterium RIFOXYD12_FULL_50_11]|uniref:Uncharacterized protein n=1 Tax=Candidatus Edwardsbacteria bacterium GWF2_54_11 TaxID=1817851 RepID=A0A1F5RG64_9BACT|nr:MAG: hypothetical protein A2502_05535 [Candidatus Edwardsbacteria bacterium RifOxyC12_full_54_24]OGF07914.1 MAG: hypothetical protein A2273_05490 [Candidatus Edwardsbacteria bacterium RifOxyA12_full_54_48]OGF10162.1 MAG: hypothetical protein A3K15_11905 [Candidatus Edwardsbacteria bacterium GWE2_54_12]OGF13103.1 MAG: hypothetical protein A2024_04820 [Candidatus Edwardsbacteria bacterium GWF2_54_11]OGF15074.1 MAG: hypothetical protein A2509_04330 [Candidatus Edwardsbacteria bacterium RIFOXYD1